MDSAVVAAKAGATVPAAVRAGVVAARAAVAGNKSLALFALLPSWTLPVTGLLLTKDLQVFQFVDIIIGILAQVDMICLKEHFATA